MAGPSTEFWQRFEQSEIGWEVAELARRGVEVTGIDYAAAAVEKARALCGHCFKSVFGYGPSHFTPKCRIRAWPTSWRCD